jgi:predicted DNA-binding protein (MmcQ/YjbR family)
MSTKIAERLQKFALTFPETTEAHPWGHTVAKVRGKIFFSMSLDGGSLKVSMKLPHSREFALDRPFTEPTHYGLGQHGWVSAKFSSKDKVPMGLLEAWIEESYRAIAPKKVVAALDGEMKPAPGRASKRAASPRARKR